ncbi:hypothetical protein BJX70DRAFT_402886 [Aspergillus crustosus]
MSKLGAGQLLLVQAAGTAVGQYAIQFAQRRMAVVIATVHTEEERHIVKDLGVDPARIRHDDDPDMAAAISGATSRKGLDVILNQSATAGILQSLWKSLAANRVLVDVDADSTDHDDVQSSLAPFRRGATYATVNLGNLLQDDPSRLARVL